MTHEVDASRSGTPVIFKCFFSITARLGAGRGGCVVPSLARTCLSVTSGLIGCRFSLRSLVLVQCAGGRAVERVEADNEPLSFPGSSPLRAIRSTPPLAVEDV